MIQPGRILGDSLVAILQPMFLIWKEVLKRGLKKGITLAKNAVLEITEKTTECYVNKGINKLNKKFTSRKGSGTTLTNNEIKDRK